MSGEPFTVYAFEVPDGCGYMLLKNIPLQGRQLDDGEFEVGAPQLGMLVKATGPSIEKARDTMVEYILDQADSNAEEKAAGRELFAHALHVDQMISKHLLRLPKR